MVAKDTSKLLPRRPPSHPTGSLAYFCLGLVIIAGLCIPCFTVASWAITPMTSDEVLGKYGVWPENSIYLKQREIIPGVVDNEMIRCQSAWTRSVSC